MARLKARHVAKAAKPQGRVAAVAFLIVIAWLFWSAHS